LRSRDKSAYSGAVEIGQALCYDQGFLAVAACAAIDVSEILRGGRLDRMSARAAALVVRKA